MREAESAGGLWVQGALKGTVQELVSACGTDCFSSVCRHAYGSYSYLRLLSATACTKCSVVAARAKAPRLSILRPSKPSTTWMQVHVLPRPNLLPRWPHVSLTAHPPQRPGCRCPSRG